MGGRGREWAVKAENGRQRQKMGGRGREQVAEGENLTEAENRRWRQRMRISWRKKRASDAENGRYGAKKRPVDVEIGWQRLNMSGGALRMGGRG